MITSRRFARKSAQQKLRKIRVAPKWHYHIIRDVFCVPENDPQVVWNKTYFLGVS